MKKIITVAALVGAALVLTGCAQAPDVQLSHAFWKKKNQNVTVARAKTAKPALYKEGPEMALDFVINEISSHTFRGYLKNTSTLWYQQFQNTVAAQLRQHHIKAKFYSRPVPIGRLAFKNGNSKTYAVKNYAPLRARVGDNKLLVIQLNGEGAQRRYYGFIPLGAPKAFCSMTGRLVNLTNNKILWRHKAMTKVSVQGAWDQPPSYPNFKVALNQAISSTKQELLDSLFTNY